MRGIHLLLAAALMLLPAGIAVADVGPPVHVRILGELRAAQPGVPFTGELQITSDAPLKLDDLKLGGVGWDQLSLAVGPQASVDKSRPLVLDFSVVTNDPGQLLVLTCTVDGLPVTRYFDLSSATIAGLQTPGATISVTPSGDVMTLTDETRVSPLPADSGPTAKLGTGSAEMARNIRVHGRFTYQRIDGWTIGADGMTVRVFDDNSPSGSIELATVVTDAQGWYDVTFTWNGGLFDSEPDLHLGFETANSRVSVGGIASVLPYIWKTDTDWNYTGNDKDYGWTQPSDINQHAAVHLQTTLVRTWRWWMGYGYDTPGVRCNWPALTGNSFFAGQIYMADNRRWNEDVISHEYGHHWVSSFASSPIPGYCNGLCDNAAPIDCGHCWWCEETAGIAFTEGFPDWMGDVIPRSFGASYGREPYSPYNMESITTCGATGVLGDPLITEGFLAAVVRDIGDGTDDDEPAFPETDEMSIGWGAIITCVDFDAPTTAAGFLAAFKNRYPWLSEQLWATAKNCGYEIDVNPPPAVTGLASPSHATSGDSPDPTIDLTWARAVDDVSGIRGYGITIADGIGLPSAVMDIGDVTGYTTPSLAPGTYYFSIRTLDRSGKWSSVYAWSGPYTVRAPLSANLAVYQFGGWDQVLLPRPAPDASFGSVPAPLTLTGNAAATWWNIGLWNSGEAYTGAGFEIRAHVDSDWHWWVWSGELGPGWGQYGVNLGPLHVRGGRHTIEARLDATEVIAETNEGDNRWAHQWVWSPLDLPANTPLVRGAPPLQTAGWEAVVDGSALFANSDGLRMGASSYWDATVLRSLDAAADHDLYLHAASAGATDGFNVALSVSTRGSGVLDAVIVNRNRVGWNAHDVGVVNYNSNGSNYEVVHATNSALAFGDSVTVSFAQDQMLGIWEFYVSPSDLGPVSFTVDVDPAVGPLQAQWRNQDFQTGGLLAYSAAAQTTAAGRARMDVNITDAGYHALLVYRDPDWNSGNGPINFTIEIQKTPPDFVPLLAAGWYAPIVPRAAFDGTGGSVPMPTTLPGNLASTFLNLAVRNESPSASPAGLPGQIYIDGGYSAWVDWGWFPAYADGLFNWGNPWTFSGGRHTLSWKLDANMTIEEIHEDNNVYGEQWVWSPLDLVNDTPVARASPADPYGGWTDLSTGEIFYPNCDGLRMPDAGGYWRAVAIMPGADSDVDLRLHPASAGAKDGFATNLAGSYWGRAASDYVLVNFNVTPGGFEAYDAGVVRYSGEEEYTTESTASDERPIGPEGVYGPYTLSANRIVNLHELRLPSGPMAVRVANQSGSVDWGMSLHPADQAYQGKSDALAYGGDADRDELLIVDVPADGNYGLAVWKTTSRELEKDGTYNLEIAPAGVTGVGDPVTAPMTTTLVGITPNPFNPATNIAFELAAEGQVQVEIYDLRGRRMRTLVHGTAGAGRHVATWNGRDDAGDRVVSGLYIVRLSFGGVSETMKVVLMQ